MLRLFGTGAPIVLSDINEITTASNILSLNLTSTLATYFTEAFLINPYGQKISLAGFPKRVIKYFTVNTNVLTPGLWDLVLITESGFPVFVRTKINKIPGIKNITPDAFRQQLINVTVNFDEAITVPVNTVVTATEITTKNIYDSIKYEQITNFGASKTFNFPKLFYIGKFMLSIIRPGNIILSSIFNVYPFIEPTGPFNIYQPPYNVPITFTFPIGGASNVKSSALINIADNTLIETGFFNDTVDPKILNFSFDDPRIQDGQKFTLMLVTNQYEFQITPRTSAYLISKEKGLETYNATIDATKVTLSITFSVPIKIKRVEILKMFSGIIYTYDSSKGLSTNPINSLSFVFNLPSIVEGEYMFTVFDINETPMFSPKYTLTNPVLNNTTRFFYTNETGSGNNTNNFTINFKQDLQERPQKIKFKYYSIVLKTQSTTFVDSNGSNIVQQQIQEYVRDETKDKEILFSGEDGDKYIKSIRQIEIPIKQSDLLAGFYDWELAFLGYTFTNLSSLVVTTFDINSIATTFNLNNKLKFNFSPSANLYPIKFISETSGSEFALTPGFITDTKSVEVTLKDPLPAGKYSIQIEYYISATESKTIKYNKIISYEFKVIDYDRVLFENSYFYFTLDIPTIIKDVGFLEKDIRPERIYPINNITPQKNFTILLKLPYVSNMSNLYDVKIKTGNQTVSLNTTNTYIPLYKGLYNLYPENSDSSNFEFIFNMEPPSNLPFTVLSARMYNSTNTFSLLGKTPYNTNITSKNDNFILTAKDIMMGTYNLETTIRFNNKEYKVTNTNLTFKVTGEVNDQFTVKYRVLNREILNYIDIVFTSYIKVYNAFIVNSNNIKTQLTIDANTTNNVLTTVRWSSPLPVGNYTIELDNKTIPFQIIQPVTSQSPTYIQPDTFFEMKLIFDRNIEVRKAFYYNTASLTILNNIFGFNPSNFKAGSINLLQTSLAASVDSDYFFYVEDIYQNKLFLPTNSTFNLSVAPKIIGYAPLPIIIAGQAFNIIITLNRPPQFPITSVIFKSTLDTLTFVSHTVSGDKITCNNVILPNSGEFFISFVINNITVTSNIYSVHAKTYNASSFSDSVLAQGIQADSFKINLITNIPPGPSTTIPKLEIYNNVTDVVLLTPAFVHDILNKTITISNLVLNTTGTYQIRLTVNSVLNILTPTLKCIPFTTIGNFNVTGTAADRDYRKYQPGPNHGAVVNTEQAWILNFKISVSGAHEHNVFAGISDQYQGLYEGNGGGMLRGVYWRFSWQDNATLGNKTTVYTFGTGDSYQGLIFNESVGGNNDVYSLREYFNPNTRSNTLQYRRNSDNWVTITATYPFVGTLRYVTLVTDGRSGNNRSGLFDLTNHNITVTIRNP